MSNSSSEVKLWFQLFDENGNYYKNTSGTKVSVKNGDIVADFRDAVKAEYAEILSSVNAADLLVYVNKDAFDMRNALGIQAQLKPSYPLDGLGNTKDEALVVVVPSRNEELQSKKISD